MASIDCNVAIAGGGLAGGLIALALARIRPELDVVIIEKGETLGGNHVWSFFAGDIAPADRWLVAPLVCHGWPAHDVRFPGHSRTIKGLYYSIESDRLDSVLRAILPSRSILTGVKMLATNPRRAVLSDGTRLEADVVIDTRGVSDLSMLTCGWQKFVGQLLELDEPHDIRNPVIMDATVDQLDGYRFMYCLPFSATRLFVEDTYYSDDRELDVPTLRARIAQWAEQNGLAVGRIVHEEAGVLPVVTGGKIDAYWAAGGRRIAKAGVRGGFFHPLTSYSLPDAVRVAAALSRITDFSAQNIHDRLRVMANDQWKRTKFYRTLGRMLFNAGEPQDRYRIFERFYELNPALIERFYAGQSTATDKVRILSGKPPVPIGGALKAIANRPRAVQSTAS